MLYQAWLERRRLRESRLKAAALRQLASEAELGLTEEGGGLRPNIVINPRDCLEQTKPARQSIVTFQIPHSDSDQKQTKERCGPCLYKKELILRLLFDPAELLARLRGPT